MLCPHCHATFALSNSSTAVKYCISCGHELQTTEATPATLTGITEIHPTTASIALIAGHTPSPEEVKFTIGPYQIIDSIGKGGMGEVFLAYDTTCGRRIALKKIRQDLLEHVQLQNRFLKEAHITSQLTHPAIIPIYTIHREDELIYYTMPYVEGKTLKEKVRNARKAEKKGIRPLPASASIPALMRIFITICNAAAYAHSKGVLHRDLKPENIIIGPYGEVMILDWGLAKLLRSQPNDDDDEGISTPPLSFHGLTHAGKVVGTVSYMAPERAFGQPATIQTDIYSLGVILYQMLTLVPPFRRGTLQEFRKNFPKEVLREPSKVAPYRDIPKVLADIAKKCLEVNPSSRYQTIDQLIEDVEGFIEGRSDWFLMSELDIARKSDWEFQEHVLISEHIAITRGQDTTDWVSLMISNTSFNGNTRLETTICIGKNGHGIGLMLCVPEVAERQHVNDGYCLWLGSDLSPTTKLLRSTLEVISRPEIILQRGAWYKITIEKVDNNIHVFLNGALQFSYISHIPIAGTHIGILSRDADFTMRPISVYVSSLNIMVNCLAVPDAFLAHKNYHAALHEYRRIAYSFPGRAEGREAQFKAGITLLEEARNTPDTTQSMVLFESALEEFSKQHNTPGAPLEYLGKGLVYQALKDYEEEIKCYELAFRRYQNHPLLPILHEQVIHRMYEASKNNRIATYSFILLSMRFLPRSVLGPSVRKLFYSLEKHWEPIEFFLEEPSIQESQALQDLNFSLKLAFWLAKPFVIEEIIEDLLVRPETSPILLSNAFYSLIELGCVDIAKKLFNKTLETLAETEILDNSSTTFQTIVLALNCQHSTLESTFENVQSFIQNNLTRDTKRLLTYMLREAQKTRNTQFILTATEWILTLELPYQYRQEFDHFRIWALLWGKQWDSAGQLLHNYPLELLSQENSLLHFLYGCWLLVTEGKDIADIHFAGIMEVPHPRSWTLVAHDLAGKIRNDPQWQEKAFLWEKRHLYQQLSLFYHCAGDEKKSAKYYELELLEHVGKSE